MEASESSLLGCLQVPKELLEVLPQPTFVRSTTVSSAPGRCGSHACTSSCYLSRRLQDG